jgi:DNA mismatch repair protein MutS
MTPMMLQYLELKENYKEYILFYRLGDFYEMFFSDAILASKELELALTGRDCGEPERAPMCGVPYHSSETYIARLIEKGYKVAVCEQMEAADATKTLVRRDVVRIITPGTVTSDIMLPDSCNNYLCAVSCKSGDAYGVCFADISTGYITASSFPKDAKNNGKTLVLNEIGTYMPREIILDISAENGGADGICDFASRKLSAVISDDKPALFDYASAVKNVTAQFGKSFIEDKNPDAPLICAVGAVLEYIKMTQMCDISYIKDIDIYTRGMYLEMDVNTRRNLELVETMRQKEKRGSLFWVLDKTKTSMGARTLRSWIEHPLVDVNAIAARQSAVSEFFSDFILREEAGETLRGILDIERLMTRINYGTASGKDLRAVADTIKAVPPLREALADVKCAELKTLVAELDEIECLRDVYTIINDAIVENPPFTVREGGIIKDGYDEGIDYLRKIMKDAEGVINAIAESEREKTGIRNLKISYNRVFGYYIEVTKSQISMVPDSYIRKQTLANCERYITEELKVTEATILGASDKVVALEYEVFAKIRDLVNQNTDRIKKGASVIAKIDTYLSLAEVAARNNYVCPEVDYGDTVDIKDGRHPVVEQFVRDSYFVPNDTYLDTQNNRLILITGPNMAGKSTFMRQSALITIMAQTGSFVPAKEARIGVVDKVFTRVGASDDLASGQSTFMLEMTEVSYILANATKRSFIIYDEVGRGTSTFDGMSIARAIAEYTCGKKIGAKTMFATHYHELTALEETVDGIVNYNIAAKKRGDTITFLRKIVRGPSDDSYGIEVAKLAGIPNEVVKRAREVLSMIENGEYRELSGADKNDDGQISITASFNKTPEEMAALEAAIKIKSVDVNTLTPLEALNFISDLKKIIE